MTVTTAYAAGSTVVVRDEEWVVSSCDRAGDGWRLRCHGSSELVRGTTATFYSSLDDIEPLDPAGATLVADTSPRFRRSRLWVEAVLRKTPMPLHEPGLTVSQDMLLDPLDYQRQAVAQALETSRLRPRLLIADAVGLGKTLEIGMILAELSRRGRAERVLVVTPRHVLEQMQYELWTRFSLPLVRLDSDGIARVRQELPASRNPFTYFPKVIVSIDTLKSARYRAHLENHHWDAVVVDESHNVTNAAAQRSELARILAQKTDALILASATPHNGRPESFANLINLLEPTTIVDPGDFSVDDIRGLFVRRHRHSPDVAREVGHMWAERLPPEILAVQAGDAEDAVATELSTTWLHPDVPLTTRGGRLFAWQLAKAFLSSPRALLETVVARQKTLAQSGEGHSSEAVALQELGSLAKSAESRCTKLDALVEHLRTIGVGGDDDERVVLFSERLATLAWLRETLPAALGMPAGAFAVLHGQLPDQQQMAVVESFQLAASPIRVLITGDVASEGVNLHKRCHHLVHVDIPWSLIRIEQRNGRIDRYGQAHPPRIVALALTTLDKQFSGDVKVLTRLLTKEHAAHRALGDAASLMRLHDVKGEEEAVRDALMNGTPIDETVPDPAPPGEIADDSEWDDYYVDAGEDVPESPPAGPRTGLFDEQVGFLREALFEAFDDPRAQVGWQEHPDESLVELVPPKDLLARLRVLPQSYLDERRVRERLLLAVTPEAGEEHLKRAIEGSDGAHTQWPLAHFLSPLHPVLDWAVDRALTRLGRNEVPVALGAVDRPTAIVMGTLTNARGQVVLRSVVGMQFLAADAPPVVVPDAEGIIRDAGLRDGAVNPHGDDDPLDVSAYGHVVPATVAAMRSHMGMLRENRREQLVEPLQAAARSIRSWRTRSLEYADTLGPVHGPRARKRVERYGRQADELVASLSARRDPMVRVLLLLVPNGGPQ